MRTASRAIYCRSLRLGVVAVVLAVLPPLIAHPETATRLPFLFLVRHAEKPPGQADDYDPPLSRAGMARAQELATALRDAGVNAIVTTELRRARATAAPLAAALALTPEVVPVQLPISRHVNALEGAVRRHPGEVLLVVGHANTVPAHCRSGRLKAAGNLRCRLR